MTALQKSDDAEEFISLFADLAAVNMYNQNGIPFCTFLFMRNHSTTVFANDAQDNNELGLSIKVESQHIASVTMTDFQLKHVYQSLKKHFENNDNDSPHLSSLLRQGQ